jgi:hypothetical protein
MTQIYSKLFDELEYEYIIEMSTSMYQQLPVPVSKIGGLCIIFLFLCYFKLNKKD